MTDLFATFAEHFSYDIKDSVAEDSFSFLPVLKDEEPKVSRESIIHHDGAGRFAVRNNGWKLILQPDDRTEANGGVKADYQLYNIGEDIDESENLVKEKPEKVVELLTLLKKQVADGRTTPGENQKNDAEVDIYKKGVKSKTKKNKKPKK